jgi:predicted O-methyltransferase YrrM
MIDTRTGHTPFGHPVQVHSNIRLEFAEALYQTVRRLRPLVTIEVGMAFGVASLAILRALRDSGSDGRLISIDPNQTSEWQGGS